MEAKLVALQQRSRGQNALRSSFSSAIASRFFMDGSLARRQRLHEATLRRQARLREKTRIEHLKSEILRRAYEEKKEIEDKKRERELDRAQRRIQNYSAEIIQSAWRRTYHIRLYWRLVHHAAALIQISIRDYVQKRQSKRFKATMRLQLWWRFTRVRRQLQTASTKISNCIFRSILTKRGHRLRLEWASALLIQRIWHHYWRHIQDAAARTIQTWTKRKQQRKKFKRLAAVHRHLKQIESMGESSSKIQRFLAKRAVRRRIRMDHTFQAQLQQLSRIDFNQIHIRVHSQTEEEVKFKAALEEQVQLLQKDINALRRETIPTATKRLQDLREKLKRAQVLESQRLVKEKEAEMKRLKELEEMKRREIRIEMEKTYDQERRDRMKLKQPKKSTAGMDYTTDHRVEVD